MGFLCFSVNALWFSVLIDRIRYWLIFISVTRSIIKIRKICSSGIKLTAFGFYGLFSIGLCVFDFIFRKYIQ